MIRIRRCLSLALLGLALGTDSALAQVSAIGVGQTVDGRLEAGDPRLEDDSHYDLYLFRGTPGERITITLRSDDFDAYLAWGTWDGTSFSEERANDDGGGGTDARLGVTISEDGSYALRANSLSSDETGSYTLSVERAQIVPVTVQAVGLGQPVSGRLEPTDPVLDDDSHFDLYLYRGEPGERVVATLRSSDFDAYLTMGDWDGVDFYEDGSDDDGGGETDARLTATVGTEGGIHIRANSLSAGEGGAPTLSWSSAAREPPRSHSPSRCLPWPLQWARP